MYHVGIYGSLKAENIKTYTFSQSLCTSSKKNFWSLLQSFAITKNVSNKQIPAEVDPSLVPSSTESPEANLEIKETSS